MSWRGRVKEEVEILQFSAPVARPAAWEVECLLVEIFERLDYSVRAALRGDYSAGLNCTFFAALFEGRIIGAAGCLCSHSNPSVCVLGPVGVGRQYRGQGIGTRLLEAAIEYAESLGCKAAYLGISEGNPAMRLYEGVGFERYKGVVMRLLLEPVERFEQEYFDKSMDVSVRRAQWGDFAQVQVLANYPCEMYTFDSWRGLFSSRYVEPRRFLSVFPEMMKLFGDHGGFANVLAAGREENVVGFAQLRRQAGTAQRHVAELEFYVHDNFVEQAEDLVVVTMKAAKSLSVEKINCCCLGCDGAKGRIIEAAGGKRVCVLPGNVPIGEGREDVVVFELTGPT